MRVKLARTAGFCMGVRRAMNAVLEAAHKSDKKVFTLGPLVHNHQAMEMLGTKKVKVVFLLRHQLCVQLNADGFWQMMYQFVQYSKVIP